MGHQYSWNRASVGGYWGTAADWTDQATGNRATAAPGVGDTVTVGGNTLFAFQILAGSGVAAVLTFLGNTALEGQFSAGSVTIGAAPLAAPYAPTDAVTVQAGATLSATATVTLATNLEADGTGATLLSHAATQGNLSHSVGSEVLVLNGARAGAASWTLALGDIFVDPLASLEVGSAGGAAAGVVTVDKAATFTLAGPVTVNDSVVDGGTLAVTGSATAHIAGGLLGGGVVTLGAGGTLTVVGSVAGLASVTIADAARFNVLAATSGVGQVRSGAKDVLDFVGGVSGNGPISLGTQTRATFQADVVLARNLTLGANATAVIDGTLSGSGSVVLAAGATLDFGQTITAATDTNVPIVLSTGNLLALDPGDTVAGAVRNFDTSDLIQNTSLQFELGGLPITSAAWNAVTGVLTLADDGVAIDSLQLAGSFAGQRFIANDVQTATGTTDIVLASGTTTGLGGTGAVAFTGGAGTAFQVLTGTGTATWLGFAGNTAVAGVFTTGTLLVGGTLANTLNATDLVAGGRLISTGVTIVQTGLEVAGPGALLDARGGLGLGGGTVEAELYVHAGGRVTTPNLLLAGPIGSIATTDTACVWVDAAASMEIGTAGTATGAGTLTVDAGSTLQGSGLNVFARAPNIVVNGTVLVAPVTFHDAFIPSTYLTGAVSGTGQLVIDKGLSLFITGGVTGLSAINEGAGSDLTITGDLVSAMSFVTGAGASTRIDSGVAGLARLEVATGANVSVGGAMLNVATLAVDGNASASITGAVGVTGGASGQITLATNATLAMFGGDTGVPITLAGNDLLKISDGFTYGGALRRFDKTDLVQALGSTLITTATVTGTGAKQTLVLSSDGVTISTIALAGAYPGQPFLTNVAGLDNTADIVLPSATLNGVGAGGVIAGATGAAMQLITGSGTVASLDFVSNNALQGTFTAASIEVRGAVANTVDALDVEAGAVLTATGTVVIQTAMELDGAGAALIDRGGLLLGSGPDEAELFVLNHAGLQAAGVSMTGDTGGLAFHGALLFVDATSSATIGAGGTAATGSLLINPGATLSTASLNVQVDVPTLVDNGTLAVLPTIYQWSFVSSADIYGNVTGSGSVTVADGTSANFTGTVANLAGITLGNTAGLLLGAMSGVGPLVTGANASVVVEGTVSGLSAISIGAHAGLELDGTVSGSGSITLGAGATATINSTVLGLSGITLGAGATLVVNGADLNVPIVMGAGSTLEIGPNTVMGGVISGFARGDLLEVQLASLGTIVTAATFTPGKGGVGSLLLTDDGAKLDTLSLAGSFKGFQFLTNAAGAGGVTDITLAATPAAGTLLHV